MPPAARHHAAPPLPATPSAALQAQKRYPLVRPPSAGEAAGQATTRVHVYSKQFALQPEEYEPVVFKNPLFSWLRRALPPWAGGSNGKK